MPHSTFLALLYSIIAGAMNGSFALPTKSIKTWSFETTWLNYSIWGFLIVPWVFIFAIDPHIGMVYRSMPFSTLGVLILGGLLFGIGQICFALALNAIGLGLGFLINIGLGTALGVLLPLITLHRDQMFSPAGLLSLLGILFILIGLLISYHAGYLRDKEKGRNEVSNQKSSSITYKTSVLLAILAGVFSAGQNYTFAFTVDMQTAALNAQMSSLASSIVIWPPFLTCTFVPYAAYMLYLRSKNRKDLPLTSSSSTSAPSTFVFTNIVLTFIMGAFWFGSLAIYSQASLLIGNLGPVIAWPLFMVLIILTSNFWSWKYQEWAHCRIAIKREALISIGTLIVAVIILGCSASLSSTH